MISNISDVKNLFVESEEAKRYDSYRPVYHQIPAEKLLQYFGRKIARTLDVACGTGHSTKALAEISDSIVGCDISESMLTEARKNSHLQFICAPAEALPFLDSEFDYLNISMAYQWFDQAQFLREAKRVLKPAGLLGIDNYGFTGRMLRDDQFLERYKSFDQQYMKAPPRNKNYPDANDLLQSNFIFVQEFAYEHQVRLNQQQFLNYLMTRSNFLGLGRHERTSVENELPKFYESSFRDEAKTLVFKGALRLYKARI